jgi:hypothetical protein
LTLSKIKLSITKLGAFDLNINCVKLSLESIIVSLINILLDLIGGIVDLSELILNNSCLKYLLSLSNLFKLIKIKVNSKINSNMYIFFKDYKIIILIVIGNKIKTKLADKFENKFT